MSMVVQMGGPSVGRNVAERAERPATRQAHQRWNPTALGCVGQVARSKAVDSHEEDAPGGAHVVQLDRDRRRGSGQLGTESQGHGEGQDRSEDREHGRRRSDLTGKKEEVEPDGEEGDNPTGDHDGRERKSTERVNGYRMPIAEEVVPVENADGAEGKEHQRGEVGPAVDHRAGRARPPLRQPPDEGRDGEDQRPAQRPGEKQAQPQCQRLGGELEHRG